MRLTHPRFPNVHQDVPDSEVKNWLAQGWLPPSGGLTFTGEAGPELVKLPAGSSVVKNPRKPHGSSKKK